MQAWEELPVRGEGGGEEGGLVLLALAAFLPFVIFLPQSNGVGGSQAPPLDPPLVGCLRAHLLTN